MKQFLPTFILAVLAGLICLCAQRCSERPKQSPRKSLEKPLRLLQPDTKNHLRFGHSIPASKS